METLLTATIVAVAGALSLGLWRRSRRASAELEELRDRLEERVRQRTRELEKSALAAEAASRAKSVFLTNMSHELRTPLNGILGAAELLEAGELTPEQRQLATLVRASGADLLRRIEDILHTSEIEAGELRLESADFRLPELVQGAVVRVTARARQKDLELAFAPRAELPRWVRTDPIRLRQVLFHLLDNAVKFTDRGKVEVLAENVADPGPAGAGRLRFEVRDTGIGIDPGGVEALFDPFAQGDDTTTRRFGGAGLGLALARRIVELMGGEIGAEPNPGGGAVFWFEVPYQPAARNGADGRPAPESAGTMAGKPS